MIIRPIDDFGLFNFHNPKLRRCGKHIGWRCISCKYPHWMKQHDGRLWLPHIEVANYLKQWNKSISDIPEVENDKL